MEDTRKYAIFAGTYEDERLVGYIIGEDNARKHCAQKNFELAWKVGKEIDPDNFDYSDLDWDNGLHCKLIEEIKPSFDEEKYNYHKRYSITLRKNDKGEFELVYCNDCTFSYYIGEILPSKCKIDKEFSCAHVNINAEDKESALRGALDLVKFELEKINNPSNPDEAKEKKMEEPEQPTANLEAFLNNDSLKVFAEKIADANSDKTEDEIIELLAKSRWKLIAHVDYGDSSAKIYRTYDLNSNVNCIELGDLQSIEDEKFIVYTNGYSEKSVYLANSPTRELTVDYCDLIMDSEEGIMFSPLTVMQALNAEITDDIDNNTVWTHEILDLFGIRMVALYPEVQI